MTPLIFATNNQQKIIEIQAAIGNQVTILTLADAGINIEIEEPFDTLEANASAKAVTIHQLTNRDCFSEDTGLEVAALGGAPGVRSARYAGESKKPLDNIHKLLTALQGRTDRSACFRTVIALIWKNKEYQFEGICPGHITDKLCGNGGFGYDPVFMPSGSKLTFAEMTMDEKNRFSHRKKAADGLVLFLQQCLRTAVGI